MPKPPYLPIEVKEWLSSPRVKRYSNAAKGNALLLLVEMWSEGADDCGLDDDNEDLAFRLGLSMARWLRVRAEIVDGKHAFFRCENGRIFSEKLLGLWRKACETSDKRADAGKKRWEKTTVPSVENQAGLEAGSSGAKHVICHKSYVISQANVIERERACAPEPAADAAPPAPEPPAEPESERPSRRSRLPEDLACTPDYVAIAALKCPDLPPEAVAGEFERWRDYHLARGTLIADRRASWRTWLSRVGRFEGPPRAAPEPVPSRGLTATEMRWEEVERYAARIRDAEAKDPQDARLPKAYLRLEELRREAMAGVGRVQ